MEIQLKDEQAQFEALKKQSEEISAQCLLLTVTDETTLAIATQQLSRCNEKIKQIDKIREEFKKPYFQAGKQIDTLAKTLSKPLEDALTLGKSRIVAYNTEQQKIAQAALNRIKAIKDRITTYCTTTMHLIDKAPTEELLTEVYNQFIKTFPGAETWFEFLPEAEAMRVSLRDYASQRKIAINTPAQADETIQEIIKEHIQETVAEVGGNAIAEITLAKQPGMKGKFKPVLVDITKVRPEWLELNEKAVKEYIKFNEDSLTDGMVLDGVQFIYEQSVTIR